MKVVRSSASRIGRLYPQECSWYSFSLEAELAPGPWCGRKEYVTDKSSDTTGNRSRDRPTSSAAPLLRHPRPLRIRYRFMWNFSLTMTNTITSQHIDVFSWITLYTPSPDSIRVIKWKRRRWAGHVLLYLVGHTENAYRILVWIPEGYGHLEDPDVDGSIVLKWIFGK
jgi:hypothetical protein